MSGRDFVELVSGCDGIGREELLAMSIEFSMAELNAARMCAQGTASNPEVLRTYPEEVLDVGIDQAMVDDLIDRNYGALERLAKR